MNTYVLYLRRSCLSWLLFVRSSASMLQPLGGLQAFWERSLETGHAQSLLEILMAIKRAGLNERAGSAPCKYQQQISASHLEGYRQGTILTFVLQG